MGDAYGLYIIELLMNYRNSMPLNSLWSCFTSRFSQNEEFLSLIGKNVSDFEIYLRKYPGLFKVENYVVSLVDNLDLDVEILSRYSPYNRQRQPKKKELFNDYSFDADALKYFVNIFMKRHDKYLSFKNLLNYLSQAPDKVRNAIGQQGDLLLFFHRHSLIFESQGDLIGLKDDYRSSYSIGQNPLSNSAVTLRSKKGNKKERPTSLRIVSNGNGFRRATMYSEDSSSSIPLPQLSARPMSMADGPPSPMMEPVITAYSGKKLNVVALGVQEYKAISWLRSIICPKYSSGPMNVQNIMKHLMEAPECVTNTIGTTQVEFVEFVNKHPLLLKLDEEGKHVIFKCISALHLIIVENRPQNDNSTSLNLRKGCVFCITKLWGIIDLGFHEHVFFDRSLFKHVTDLTKHFKVGEPLFFNAIIAQKESRAKWRATRVWKESDKVAAKLARKQQKCLTDSLTDLHSLSVSDSAEVDSGFDNPLEEEEIPSERKTNQPLTLTTLADNPSLVELLSVEGVNLTETLSAFRSARMADPWEVSAFIAQSADLADGSGGEPQLEEFGENVQPFSGPPMIQRQFTAPPHLSAASSPVSEVDTMSGVPSICVQEHEAAAPNNMSEENFNMEQELQRLTLVPMVEDKVFAPAVLPPPAPKKLKPPHKMPLINSVATQTLATGDIMATNLYHDDNL